MSHEHRQHPERYYDDEGEAYEDSHFDYLDSMEAVGAFDALADDKGEAFPDSGPYSWTDLNHLFEQWDPF